MTSAALKTLPSLRSFGSQLLQVSAGFALLAGPTALLGWVVAPLTLILTAWAFHLAHIHHPLQLPLSLAGGLVVGGSAAFTGALGGVAGMVLMALVGAATLVTASLLEL